MSNQNDIKLVLNIDTPDYFQKTTHHTTVKRALPEPFFTIKPKRAKVVKKITGAAFKSSSKSTNKLKIGSAISAIEKTRINHLPKLRSSAISSESQSRTQSKPNSGKRKVSFNSEIKVHTPNSETKKPEISSQSTRTDNVETHKQQSYTNKTSKPISSLFTKNPEIPILEQNDCEISSREVFSNVSFNETDFSPKLVSDLEKLGYSKMTLVQNLSMPIILSGKDALIKSQTGSGKTLAYSLPIVHKLMTRSKKISRKDGLYALIVVPTRELAVQTYQWLEKICKTCIWIVPGYLIGGEKKKAEKGRLRKGINILIATPGRLIDHINNTNSLNFNNLHYLVLDEADRMLDMGYEKNINSIIYALNEVKGNVDQRQTIMLSATLTNAVQKLAGISLVSPQIVDITSDGSCQDGMSASSLSDCSLVTPQNLSNYYMLVPTKLRLVSLAAFIIAKCKFTNERKVIVFMTTQDMVDYHTSLFAHVVSRLGRPKPKSALEAQAERVLSGNYDENWSLGDKDEEDFDHEDENEIHFMKLHGNMTQPERTAVFKSFHKASSGVLLCTDVASRGVDLPFVNWIVQFNPACESSDYVHRVGRTARVDQAGSAVVFVTPAETGYITMLEKHGISFKEIRMTETLERLVDSSLYDKESEKVPQSMEVAATRLQDKFENAVENDKDMKNLAIQGYVSFVRSYAAIPKSAREYFCFKLLHLGHCAKSFALQDPPSVLGGKGTKVYERKMKKDFTEKDNKISRMQEPKHHRIMIPRKVVSEFDSGLDAIEEETKQQQRREMKNRVRNTKIINKRNNRRR